MQPRTSIVDFHLSVRSRHSYLASTQLSALEAEIGMRFNWRAVDSARLIAMCGHNPFAASSGVDQHGWDYRRRNAEAWADFYGVPFREPHGRIALNPDLLSLAYTAAPSA